MILSGVREQTLSRALAQQPLKSTAMEPPLVPTCPFLVSLLGCIQAGSALDLQQQHEYSCTAGPSSDSLQPITQILSIRCIAAIQNATALLYFTVTVRAVLTIIG